MTITIDTVVGKYMQLRHKKDEITREAKAKTDAINEQMGKLEGYLLQRMQDEGVTSYKTPHGTAFSTTTDYANVADWEATLEYIKQNELYDMLEKRVNKTAVRAIIDSTGTPPPGVNYGTRIDVNVRKPVNTKEK